MEVDLENNPVDSYAQVASMLQNKKDILVVNLRLAPIFLTISTYEQLLTEVDGA